MKANQPPIMTCAISLARSLVLIAACLGAGTLRVASAPVTPAPTCRDLEQRFDSLAADSVSAHLNPLLFLSADAGCGLLARRLLDAGASLDGRDRFGARPLARAARVGHVALIELFVSRGAAIDARNLVGTTALYGAAENERHGSVARLLAHGADPDLPGPSGVTPLAAAAFKGNSRIVETLLARGVETGCLPLAPEAPSAGSPGLVLLGATPDEEALALAVRRAAARAGGPHAVRLAFAEPRLPCDPEDGASWAARYGLDDPAWRAALLRLAAADLPHAAVQLHAAIGFQRLAVHPLCELFAGNGLFERNPELLQNIL